jgi:hypothetical protein
LHIALLRSKSLNHNLGAIVILAFTFALPSSNPFARRSGDDADQKITQKLTYQFESAASALGKKSARCEQFEKSDISILDK